MDKKKVIIWSIVGVVGAVGLALTGVAIGKKIKKKKAKEKAKKKEDENLAKLEISQKQSEGQQAVTSSGTVTPSRDINRALNNNFAELKGVTLYPAQKSSSPAEGHLGAEGFANVRTSAEVNNSQGLWDAYQTNLLYTVKTGEKIGTVIAEKSDGMSPPIRWFQVKLAKPYDGWFGDYTEGWVRGDAVTFKPYKKAKSSFEGDEQFVEHYDTSYPLGADVFPHPNWMLPNSEEPIHQSYDIDDVMMDI
jgi:hypothetical protein